MIQSFERLMFTLDIQIYIFNNSVSIRNIKIMISLKMGKSRAPKYMNPR